MLEAAKTNKDGEYHYPAGQFILKLLEKYGGSENSLYDLIEDSNSIKRFVESLFVEFACHSLSTYISPSPKMIKKWRNEGGI